MSAPSGEMILHCDAPRCTASLSMLAGVPREEHGWGRATFYSPGGVADYDLCTTHYRRVMEALSSG